MDNGNAKLVDISMIRNWATPMAILLPEQNSKISQMIGNARSAVSIKVCFLRLKNSPNI